MKILGMGVPELTIILIGIAIPALFGIPCMNLAKKKGYSPGGFFALGFFFPLIGVIVILCLSDKNAQQNAAALQGAPQTLMQYKQLLDQGIITPEEFEAKKQQLMS